MLSNTLSAISANASSVQRITTSLARPLASSYTRPEVREVGTQTTPGLLSQHQLPSNKRTWSRAFGSETVTSGVPAGVQNAPNMPWALRNQATQVPGASAQVIAHPAMPHTLHYLPDAPGCQVVTGPRALMNPPRP